MIKEAGIQRMIRAYLAARGIESIHIPNGAVLAGDAKARGRQMGALKNAGLKIGFPDLLLFAPQGRIGFIEVKSEGGRVSPEQKACHEWLIVLGHKVSVCRSIEDVAETLEGWGWA